MMAYKRYETKLFQEQLESIATKDKSIIKRIEKAVARLATHPDIHDGSLHGTLAGHLKKWVGRNKYRIIYKYCEYCHQVNGKQCEDCDRPDNSVIFCSVRKRDKAYD